MIGRTESLTGVARMSKRRPAYSQTEVPVGKSMDAIRQMLVTYGATHIALLEHPTQIEVAFQGADFSIDKEEEEEDVVRGLPIRLTFNINKVLDRLRKVHPNTPYEKLKDRAQKTTWRQAYHYLKATLEAVDIGIFTLYEGLLAGFTGPDGRTLAQIVAPRLEQMSRGQRISLLPPVEEEEEDFIDV